MRGSFNEGVFAHDPMSQVNQKPIWHRFGLIQIPKNQIPLRGLVSGGFWLGLGDILIIHDKAPRAHQVSQYGFCNIAAPTRSRG